MSNGTPPQLPDPATSIPRPARDRAVSALLKFLVLPGVRPNRRAIEAHLRIAAKLTQLEVNATLIEMYDHAAELGVVDAR